MSETTKLKDIITGKDNCKVFGRLIRLWDSRYATTNTLINIDGILLDDDGTTAQISIPKKFEKEFRSSLAEDNVYIFSGVTAIHRNNKPYTYDLQSYILQFTSTTKVHRLESRGADIPHHAFNFCSFDGLPHKSVQSKPLLDLIGIISDIGPYDFAGPRSQKKNWNIRIRNLDEQEQQIALWDHEGQNFDEKQVIDMSKEGIVVGIFAGLTASKFSGKYEASSSSATRVYINLDYPEVTNYQTSYKWGTPILQQKLPNTHQITPLETAGKLHSIQEILQLPTESFEGGKLFNCIAEVTAIVQSMNWYYKACKKCKTGYSVIYDTPRCQCTYPVQSPEFKLPLTIKDASSTMDCIAFYTVAEELVGCSALEASKNMQIEPDNQPPALKTAIGKKRLFHIGMSKVASSKNPISYVLKRSFTTDDQPTNALDGADKETPMSQEKIAQDGASTPPSTETIQSSSDQNSSSQAKRKLDVNQVDPNDTQGKQQKKQ